MGNKRFKKRPEETGRIKTHSSSTVSSQELPPIFSLHLMGSGKYSVPNCGQDIRACFAEAIYRRAQLTWAQICQTQSHGLGFEMMPRFRIKTAIPASVTEDVQKFMVFRCAGNTPMVGYREGAVFHVLWIDHDFSLYDH